MRKFFLINLVLQIIFFSNAVFADIERFEFYSLSHEKIHTQTASSPDQYWLDPKGDLKVYLSAGVERYVGLSIKNQSQETLFEYLSPLIDASSNFEIGGIQHYGQAVTVPKQSLQDGLLSFSFRLLDSHSRLIQQKTQLFRVSTQLPVDTSPINPMLAWQAKNGGRTVENDFLFVVDVSSSMASQIEALKNSVIGFSGKLAQFNADNRYAALAVSDPFENEEGKWHKKFDFSDQVIEFKTWVSALATTGGEEFPYHAARWGIQHMPWRDGANQYIIMVSDKPPHAEADIINDAIAGHNLYIFSPDDEYQQVDGTHIKSRFDEQSLLEQVSGRHAPLISQVQRTAGKIVVTVMDAYYGLDDGQRWAITDSAIHLSSDNATAITLAPETTAIIDGAYRITFDLKTAGKQLAEGHYEMKLTVEDNLGNQAKARLGDLNIDSIAPSIVVFEGVQPFEGGVLQDFERLSVSVTDAAGPDTVKVVATLTGGAEDITRNLELRSVGKGKYKVMSPSVFSSVTDLDSYTLNINAIDMSGNEAKQQYNLIYKPEVLSLRDGVNNLVHLPAFRGQWQHLDGTHALHTEAILLDGLPLAATYTLRIYSSVHSATAIMIGEQRLLPGKTIRLEYDFAAGEGRLNLPINTAVEGKTGDVKLVATVNAPNMPVLETTIRFWTGQVRLVSPSWSYRQVVDDITISAHVTPGTPCRLSFDEDEAKTTDPIRDPVCWLAFDSVPPGLNIQKRNVGVALQGVADHLGPQTVRYEVLVFDRQGRRFKFAEGEQTLTIRSAKDAFTFKIDRDLTEAYRSVRPEYIQLDQIAIQQDCILTLDAQLARNSAASRSYTKYCLLEWLQTPEDLAPLSNDQLTLVGHFSTKGRYHLKWRISVFNSEGTRITITEEAHDFEVKDPPQPSIQLLSTQSPTAVYFVSGKSDAYMGDLMATALKDSEIDLQIFLDGQLVMTERSTSGSLSQPLRIKVEKMALWQRAVYKVVASYAKMPEVRAEAYYTVVRVPEQNIVPTLQLTNNTLINTEPVPVTVNMQSQYLQDYLPDTMGDWQVRLLVMLPKGEEKALTEFRDISPNGKADFELDLSMLSPSDNPFLLVEAKLKSPLQDYERTERSIRPTLLQILSGQAISATLNANKHTGLSPLWVNFRVGLNKPYNTSDVRDITWEVSENSTNWSNLSKSANTFNLLHTFESVGVKKVRAKIVNRHSGAVSYTNEIEISTYFRPELQIQGPNGLLVGSAANFKTLATYKGHTLPTEDMIVEWSTDRGKTFTHTGPEFSIPTEVPITQSLQARARLKQAPDTPNFYGVAKLSVAVVKPKPVRVSLVTPRKMEVGTKNTIVAKVSSKNPGTANIEGYFTLPDGSTVAGDTLEYQPSDADGVRRRVSISYTAWLSGHKETTQTTGVSRASVWKYEWPAFKITFRKSKRRGITTIAATVDPRLNNSLEGISYQWILPDGVQVINDRKPYFRGLSTENTGTLPVKVVVKDARGNESVLEETIMLN